MTEILKDFLFWLSHPSFWFMNYRYSKEWDKVLNELMFCNNFIYQNRFYTKLANLELWIENYPYECLHHPKLNVRPSRRIVKKAYEKYTRDCLKNIKPESLKNDH